MSTSMKLDILTPVGPAVLEQDKGQDPKLCKGIAVAGVQVPGLLGELGILPDHESFITAVVPGVVRFRDGAKSVRLAVGSGFVEVKDGGRVVILCERAVGADDVDKAAVEVRLQAVKGELSGYSGPTRAAEYRDLATERAWLEAQLAV